VLWIKTRVGLLAFSTDLQVRAVKWEATGTWGLMAYTCAESQAQRGWFRSRVGGTWHPLACFRDHSGVEGEIGKALQLIADGVGRNEQLCDLSQVGSPDAWAPAWKQIHWP